MVVLYDGKMTYLGPNNTISDRSILSPLILEIGVLDGGLYGLFVDLVELVHINGNLDACFIFEEAYVNHAW